MFAKIDADGGVRNLRHAIEMENLRQQIGQSAGGAQNAKQPVVRSVRNYRKQILESPRKRLTSEPQYAITRILSLGDLGFDVNPKTLWDDAFEFDETPPAAPESH